MVASSQERECICIVLIPEKLSGVEIGSLQLGNYRLFPGENWVPKDIRNYPRYTKYIQAGVIFEKLSIKKLYILMINN
ncbi:MAG: hypothetical protein AAF208_08990 [Cyanobacteria bacterium P01_A01_bin.45]